ncbi:MAG: FGGY-family carbohydrate kinase, partial [Armatimonadota bacterium]|nr:FGGY-family carbohydrate kinase [Armatimonadota bacterium]
DCHLTLPKMLWLRAHEPEVLDAAAFVVQAKDYVVGRLTSVVGLSDPSDASLTGAFDVARRVWASDLWQAAGLNPRLLPVVVPSAQIVGQVTLEAASATGLTAGTPVVMGGGDGACATAGSGVAPGEAYNYLGGTSWIGLNADAPLYDPRLSNYCSLDQRVTVFGTVQAAGSSLEWFAGTLGEADPAALDISARDVPPGARNLFFLPYLQGERAPLWDSNARGVFFGLATHHQQADLYRAVLEGVGFALRSIVDVFVENGHALPALRLLGGGAKSELWRSILVNIYARRLRTVADVSAATSLGAAMAAGVGAGLFASWDDARRLVRIAR